MQLRHYIVYMNNEDDVGATYTTISNDPQRINDRINTKEKSLNQAYFLQVDNTHNRIE